MSKAIQRYWPALLLSGLALAGVLAGCSSPPGVASSTVVPTRSTRLPPPPFNEVSETEFVRPADPLPEGPAVLTGLYGQYGQGDRTFKACHMDQGVLKCTQGQIDLDTSGPLLVEINGQVAGGQLTVQEWQPLAWDQEAGRTAAQAKLDQQADTLSRYDWSLIALPNYAESSAWFHPDAQRLKGLSLELFGYDTSSQRVVWRAEGWEMPQQQHLVHRFPVFYFLTDPAGKEPATMVVTIEGYVEE